jgi:hypothetical protein
MRSEPSALAESSESVRRGSSAVTGRKCPSRDRRGVRACGVLDEVGRGVRLMVKSEPAEASNGSEKVPGKISNALTTDLCNFVATTGCISCVVGVGYVAVTDGEDGRWYTESVPSSKAVTRSPLEIANEGI